MKDPAERDFRELCWIVNSMREDSQVEPFVEGIASFIHSAITMPQLDGDGFFSLLAKVMGDGPLGLHIIRHLATYTNETLGRDRRQKHAAACVTALWPLVCYIRNYPSWDSDGRAILPALEAVSKVTYGDCIRACVMCRLLKVGESNSELFRQLVELGVKSSGSKAARLWSSIQSNGSGHDSDRLPITNARFLVLVWIITSLKSLSIPKDVEMRLPFGISERFVAGSNDTVGTSILRLFVESLKHCQSDNMGLLAIVTLNKDLHLALDSLTDSDLVQEGKKILKEALPDSEEEVNRTPNNITLKIAWKNAKRNGKTLLKAGLKRSFDVEFFLRLVRSCRRCLGYGATSEAVSVRGATIPQHASGSGNASAELPANVHMSDSMPGDVEEGTISFSESISENRPGPHAIIEMTTR